MDLLESNPSLSDSGYVDMSDEAELARWEDLHPVTTVDPEEVENEYRGYTDGADGGFRS